MTEKQSPEAYYFEDMIDLRALIKTLWKGKWVIIGAVLLAAVAAYVIDNFILPPTYEASAQIGIRRETFYADFEPSIENPSGLEDYRYLSDLTGSLPQLAEAEDLELTVCEQMGLVCTGEDHYRPELEAALLGSNQLKLTVSCESPQRCADFANTWAAEVIKRWNTLYGNEAVDLDQLAVEVEEARKDWEEAQTALEDYLPESRVKVVETQLGQARHELNQSLLDIENNNRIIWDADALDARLGSLPQDSELSLGDALSLIALQQRSTGGISGTQFQIPEGALLGQGYSVATARESIFNLIASLADQNQELAEILPELENKITDLVLNLENEYYQIDELTVERDRAKDSYQALARHLDEVTLNLRYQGKSAYLLAQARVPEEDSGSTMLLVLVSSIVVGLFVVGGVLIYHWWQAE